MQSIIQKFNSKSGVFLFITVVHITLISFLVLPFYEGGDQYYYRKLYAGLEGLSLDDGFYFYRFAISSEEPVYFFLSWLFSNLSIDKDVFITIANVVLGVVGYKSLLKLGSKPYIAYIIVSFNFYFLVFYFSAERLKFALIFLLILFISKRYKFLYALISMLSHSQIIIVYVSILAPKLKPFLYDVLIRFKAKYIYFWAMILLVTILSIVFSVLGNHIFSKIEAYYTTESTVFDLLRMLVFFALSFFYSRSKIDTIYAFLPLLLLVFFLGGERVNFIGYFVFLYFSIYYRGGLNFGVVFTNFYFIYMGYAFLNKIVKYGNGF